MLKHQSAQLHATSRRLSAGQDGLTQVPSRGPQEDSRVSRMLYIDNFYLKISRVPIMTTSCLKPHRLSISPTSMLMKQVDGINKIVRAFFSNYLSKNHKWVWVYSDSWTHDLFSAPKCAAKCTWAALGLWSCHLPRPQNPMSPSFHLPKWQQKHGVCYEFA